MDDVGRGSPNPTISSKKLIRIFAFPIFILVAQFFLVTFDAYRLVPWIDIPMHFFGGVSIGASFFLLIRELQRSAIVGYIPPLATLIIVISMVGLAAVIWEMGEFAIDTISAVGAQVGLADTMGDLFLGLCGGSIGCLIMMRTRHAH